MDEKSGLLGLVVVWLVVGGLALATAVVGVSAVGVLSVAQGQDTTTTDTPDLDLQEANVVGVEVESVGDSRCDFSVTLLHDDDGEEGYANWWQVESLNGTELGRRDLAHPHGTEPFTRSARIEIPDTVSVAGDDGGPGNSSVVVVRGHDQTHGYGGQAMVVDLRTGATEAVQQGSEPWNFSECEVVQRGMETDTTTTRTAEGSPRTANVTATTTAATATTTAATATTTAVTATVTETDLVRCPWEESADETTTVNRTA